MYTEQFNDRVLEIQTGPWTEARDLSESLGLTKPKGVTWDNYSVEIAIAEFNRDGLEYILEAEPEAEAEPDQIDQVPEPEAEAEPDQIDQVPEPEAEAESAAIEPEGDQTDTGPEPSTQSGDSTEGPTPPTESDDEVSEPEDYSAVERFYLGIGTVLCPVCHKPYIVDLGERYQRIVENPDCPDHHHPDYDSA